MASTAPRDYNAWLGKITCKRLGNGTDADAYESAAFLAKNLPRDSTTGQTWLFLNSAVSVTAVVQDAILAGQHEDYMPMTAPVVLAT
jgi:hypothetical protein